jgi:hypothetical protein
LKLEGAGGSGEKLLLLRLPKVVSHKLEPESPLWDWRHGSLALAKDADSEIVVVVRLFLLHHSPCKLFVPVTAVFADCQLSMQLSLQTVNCLCNCLCKVSSF